MLLRYRLYLKNLMYPLNLMSLKFLKYLWYPMNPKSQKFLTFP
jgi:hypothetical protein